MQALKKKIDLDKFKDREELHLLMQQIKSREDKKLGHNMEEHEIQVALQDIKRIKAGLVKEDKKHEMQELDAKRASLQKELKQLEADENFTINKQRENVQKKVDKSDYLTNKHQEEIHNYK